MSVADVFRFVLAALLAATALLVIGFLVATR